MKSWLGAFASLACMLVLAGSALAQGGELIGAEWGVPGRKVDVTSRVRTFVHDGVLQLEVTRFNLGIDPAPHENKVLVIRLREWDGDSKITATQSGALRDWNWTPTIGTRAMSRMNARSAKNGAKCTTGGATNVTSTIWKFCARITEPKANS